MAQFIASLPYWVITIITAVLILIVLLVLLALYILTRRMWAYNRIVVKVLIDIYPSGNHHVEFIPLDGVHPVDQIQLIVSYISNLMFVTAPDTPVLTGALQQLFEIVAENWDLSDE